ncbi:thioredoxin-like domain-containing protein [Xylariales sp. PMI_506]|nr:thioredoxin-like domain-containing protein [Xylariales sp. PMI_506]
MKVLKGRFAMVLAGLAATAFAWGSKEVAVVGGAEELTSKTFQEFIGSAEVAMVDCGHCQRFSPKFDAAAKTIADNQLDAKLGKVDCTVQGRLCMEKGIRSYPTMKIYKKGEELYHEYTGPRRVSAIVEFVEKQVLPTVSNISSRMNLKQFLLKEKSEVVLVGYINDSDEDAKKQFIAAAEKLHEDFPIALVTDADLIAEQKLQKTPSIVLYEPWEEGTIVYDGEFKVEAIKKFAVTSFAPLVGELSAENFRGYTTDTPTGFLFATLGDDPKEWRNKLKPIAKKHKLRIAIADAGDFSGFANSLAAASNGFPSFVVYDPASRQKFALDVIPDRVTPDRIGRFAEEFLGGRIAPAIKSEPVPATQDGPVTIVVGKTFEQIVMDPTKDVLINFFREDCPYCKALAPTWAKLGEVYKKPWLSEHIVVAAVDATKNELDHRPAYVPAIRLYKAGDKSNPIDYTGHRSIQDLIKFVKEHSTNGLDANAAATPEEPIINDQPEMHGQSPMVYGHDEL